MKHRYFNPFTPEMFVWKENFVLYFHGNIDDNLVFRKFAEPSLMYPEMAEQTNFHRSC
jgi:hypothetical protein